MDTRRFWSALLIVAALSALLVAVASPANAQLRDDEAIRSLEGAGILAGTNCSTETCDGDLLRWEAALWMARALDLMSGGTDSTATAPNGRDAIDAVAVLARHGVTVGCSAEPFRFCSDSHTARAEMASFLARAFDITGRRLKVYADVDPQDVHAGNISAIWRERIALGCARDPLRYCPYDPITRRHAAVMLSRALRQYATDSDSFRGGSPSSMSRSGGPVDTPTNTTTCAVADHVNTHHDDHDHRGDPDGETSFALLSDGTLVGHRHDHGDAKCWRWDPPDENGEGSSPQNVAPPSHAH